MAKVKDLEGGLMPKKNLKKRQVVQENQATKITKKIHQPDKEKLIKTSIDLPETIYKRMKINLVNTSESMKGYLVRLIEKDLEGK